MKLKIQNSCEVDNLISCLIATTNKKHKEIESALFSNYIYPESTKTFLTTEFGKIVDDPNFEWLNNALEVIFKENNIDYIYVTNAI